MAFEEGERGRENTAKQAASTNTVKLMNPTRRWMGHVTHMGQTRNMYNTSVGKPEGRRPLGRPRYRQGKIKMILKERGCGLGPSGSE
jgi:hypothetical protein